MGDRANVVVVENDEQVCLYTHWMGSELPDVLRSALKRGKTRWTDGQYLARVIFCEMVRGDMEGTTGFGISQTIGDGGNQVIVVNIDEQTVSVNGAGPIGFEAFVGGSMGWGA